MVTSDGTIRRKKLEERSQKLEVVYCMARYLHSVGMTLSVIMSIRARFGGLFPPRPSEGQNDGW
jgi:hypothetical protein